MPELLLLRLRLQLLFSFAAAGVFISVAKSVEKLLFSPIIIATLIDSISKRTMIIALAAFSRP